MEMEQETVYGTHEDSHVVMSEKVQSLAGSIYQEFEKMIGKYDEAVVKDLMPLVVNVLECLDLSYTENQEHEVELELLREDNEQLVTQYEREKQLRKTTEQKLLEIEDAGEDERKDLVGKIESLESIVRMLELKAKNSSDHVYRLEEKEQEQKKEYAKLHERYTELFKTHMDYMERTKILMGSAERLEGTSRRLQGLNMGQMSRSSGPMSYGFASLEAGMRSITSPGDYSGHVSPPDSNHSSTSLRNELQEMQVGPDIGDDSIHRQIETSDKGQLTDVVSIEHRGTITKGGWVDGFSPGTKDSTPDIEDVEELSSNIVSPIGRSKTKKEQRSGNTLYQELSFQDAEALGEIDDGADITGSWVHPGEYASSVNDNFFGMGKEVENLILENNELLATKNALNIVKDDLIVKVDELTSEQEILREEIKSLHTLKSRLQDKIQDLEEELKRVREEAEKANKAAKSDDEEDVPMAQRKRFTRVEMARVLMERNQYKERFMELQEAVRWTEMIRASRNDPTALDKKSKQGIWKFFSNLFSPADRLQHKPLQYVNVRYNAPTHHVSPALDTMRKRSQNDRKRGLDFFDGEMISSEKLQQRRATERREQYRQVRAHVRKDDGRLQAYGWSLPAKLPGQTAGNMPARMSASTCSTSHVPVPVPVYCRPLTEKEPGMKVMQVWCAAGVNLTGGRTRDGGSVVGASVFYTQPNTNGEEKGGEEQPEKECSEIEKLDEELKEGEKVLKEGEELEQQLSSFVWICTSTHSASKVTVIDANNPADILESFNACTSHVLCIASVPGAKESDYLRTDEPNNKEALEQEEMPNDCRDNEMEKQVGEKEGEDDPAESNIGLVTFVSCATGSEAPQPPSRESECESGNSLPTHRLIKEVTGVIKDGVSEVSKENEVAFEEVEKMSSVLPTMWLGSQSGNIYVHSAVAQWRRCLHSVELKDSVLSIVHIQGRVLAALADGTVAVFKRGMDGQWDLGHYHLVVLGCPQHSIRCMVTVHGRVWCGYRNKIHVLNPHSLAIVKSFDAHPRKESQVRQMAWLGDGVWTSIRLDSTLRLYHAHTYQHLQDVDIEPYVSKMLGTGKLGFSFVRITALLISSSRLWIGTGNGVIISVPLSENAGCRSSSVSRVPGGVVRVYADNNSSKITPGSFIPYCSMAQAQLSFHGHRDAVKFFVAVPGTGSLSVTESTPIIENMEVDSLEAKKSSAMLVMSGGEGYIDFRIGDGEEGDGETVPSAVPREQIATSDLEHQGERSHLIVWQVALQD